MALNGTDIYSLLEEIQRHLAGDFYHNRRELRVNSGTYYQMRQLYLNNYFKEYTSNMPIFVYGSVTDNGKALGNRLGNFFEVMLI
jgi:hypothetical protein